MTIVRCAKCDVAHDVDFTDRYASLLCEACRPNWDQGKRNWMREKMRQHKLDKTKKEQP